MASDFHPRYDSVDALRGIAVAAMLLAAHPGDARFVYPALRQSEWEGFAAIDLVFPTFLFVVGVSVSLAREKLTDGAVIARAVRIVGLGFVLHALAYLILDRPEYRIPGVLQRVGLCYGAAALLALHTRRGAQWTAIVAILLGYWAWMGWGEPYTPDNRPDPEGLTSMLPAVATTLIGLRAGDWLREGQLRRIVAAGIAALLLAELWSQAFAFNRTAWTSSFALWSAGWAMIALALMDVAIDRQRWPAIGRRLGRNAIVVYAGAWLMAILLEGSRWQGALYVNAFRWLPTPEAASLAYAVAFTVFWWIVAVALDRRRTYVTI
jgi:predicted acyltransferase